MNLVSIELFELGGPSNANPSADLLARRYSTFAWRTRLALAHKGLAFTTHPVKVSDKASIAFSGQKKVPIIRDGATVVVDSFKIAEYLEKTYPEALSLFGGETGRSLARFFNSWVDRQLVGTLVPSLMIDNVKRLEPDDATHLRTQFESGFEAGLGKTLEELAASRDKAIATFQKQLDPVRSTLRSQPFVSGALPRYADYILFSALQWPRITSTTPILRADDVVGTWFERMLDLYEGMGTQGARRDMILVDWLAAHVQSRGAQDALRQDDRRVTWTDLAQQVAALAASLDRIGIAKGDVIAVQLPNIIEFVVAYLAITSRGAVMQTVHMPYRAGELRTLLAHSGAVAAIVLTEAKDYRAADTLLAMQSELPKLREVITIGAPVKGAQSFAAFTALVRESAVPREVDVQANDRFLLLYTSGTTTAPKGVPHTYANFLENSRRSAAELSVTSDDVLLSAAPFTHLYGLFTLNMALAKGATMRLLPVFAPADLAALLTSGEPTIAFTAPAHIAACLGQKLFDGKRLRSLRYVQISGSAVPPELGRAFEPLLEGGKVMQLWGMTELQAGAFTRMADTETVRVETTGCPSPGTELRVVRDDGSLAAFDEIGELQMREPSLFAGYLDNPEATQTAFTADGWFRTGDLASIDAAGNTRLAGRTKDIINRGGVKFNPLDVENLMLEHASVTEAAVIPMPDPLLGERACLCVTLRSGASLSLGEVQSWLDRHQIAKLKWPERLEVVSAMPLTPTRKIIKSALVRQFNKP